MHPLNRVRVVPRCLALFAALALGLPAPCSGAVAARASHWLRVVRPAPLGPPQRGGPALRDSRGSSLARARDAVPAPLVKLPVRTHPSPAARGASRSTLRAAGLEENGAKAELLERLGVPPAISAGLEESRGRGDGAGFVSQSPTISGSLRERLLDGDMTPEAFVRAVIGRGAFVRLSPSRALAPVGARYAPGSIRMRKALIPRFRRLAGELVDSAVEDGMVARTTAVRALTAVDALFDGLRKGTLIHGHSMRRFTDNEVVEMVYEVLRVATGADDFWKRAKREANDLMLQHLAAMDAVVDGDWLKAITLGIIGNALDLADDRQRDRLRRGEFNVTAEIQRAAMLEYPPGLDARREFLTALDAASGGEVLDLLRN